MNRQDARDLVFHPFNIAFYFAYAFIWSSIFNIWFTALIIHGKGHEFAVSFVAGLTSTIVLAAMHGVAMGALWLIPGCR